MNCCRLTETVVRMVLDMDLAELGQTTIDHLAQRLGVGRTLLCKRFKHDHGITLGLFIKTVKMIKCQLYLCRDRDVSIKKLSQISGFEDSEYFAKIFKSHFGKPPSQYDPFTH